MSRRQTGLLLSVMFVVALVMGPGPGILLVNKPTTILGLPAIYAWGLLWYIVEVGVVVAAYLWVWRDDDEPSGSAPAAERKPQP